MFAAFVDDLIVELQQTNLGAKCPDPNLLISCVFYADDVILMSNDIHKLKKLLKICEQHSINWAYKFNPKKCKTIIYNDPTITNHLQHLNKYTNEQKDKIQREYVRSVGTILRAPMFVISKPTDKQVWAIDIDGNECKYDLCELPPKFDKAFQEHCKAFASLSTHPFPMLYDNLIYDKDWCVSVMHHELKLDNTHLQVKYKLRYLGAQLCSFDDMNLVSTIHTNKSFLKKLDAKAKLLSEVDFDCDYISLDSKIRIIKTFYLVYTEIFAQILDSDHINLIEATKKQMDIIKQYTNIKMFDPIQMSLYTGIPFPVDRWETIKLTFYWKLLKSNPISYMHKWTTLPHINHHKLYKQFHYLKNNRLHPIPIEKDGNTIMMHPFDVYEKPQALRPIIVEAQHKEQILQLNKYHPLRILNYITSDYRSMHTYESEQLEEYITKKMIIDYRQLFYNFNKQNNYCSLCYRNVDTPIETHLIIYCHVLDEFRRRYWDHARFDFAKIGAQINKTHSQFFMQHLIEFCNNVLIDRQTLWSIICGANDYDTDTNKFKFTHMKLDINIRRFSLLRSLTSKIHLWINHVYRIATFNNNKNISLKYFDNKYCYQNTNDLIYHIRSPKFEHWRKFIGKIQDNDILIGVDSSHDLNMTGFGIIIKDQNKFHIYAQPLGSVSNHYGELFAICKNKHLFSLFNIDTDNRRIIIFTDSLYNFIPLITTPKNVDKLNYSELFKKTQSFLLHNKIILWKIKSHTKPNQQFFNQVADFYARYGRLHPSNCSNISPDISDDSKAFIYSHIHHTCPDIGTIDYTLPRMFKHLWKHGVQRSLD